MSISYKMDSKGWDKLVREVKTKVSPAEIGKILYKTASNARTDLTRKPRGRKKPGTGETAGSWRVDKLGGLVYNVLSTSKVALFLEKGTKAHGPKFKKFLYIPLKASARVWRKGLIFGRDYILTKKVRGIKAWNYLQPQAVKSLENLRAAIIKILRKVGN